MDGEAMRTWQAAERVLAGAGVGAGSSVALQLAAVLNAQGALLRRAGRLEEALAKLQQVLSAYVTPFEGTVFFVTAALSTHALRPQSSLPAHEAHPDAANQGTKPKRVVFKLA
jgi:hypothetical protein